MTEKLYSIILFKKGDGGSDPILLTSAIDTSSFPILQRVGVGESLRFFGRTAASRTNANTRQQFVEHEYRLYTHARDDGLICAVTCNEHYKDRVAFSLCGIIMKDFCDNFAGQWENEKLTDNHFKWAELNEKLKKFQDPKNADQVTKIQQDLDDIQTLMTQNLEKVLERGDKMSDLVCFCKYKITSIINCVD